MSYLQSISSRHSPIATILEVAVSGTVGTMQMGPVSTVICELANQFAARGHRVTLADVTGTQPRKLLRPEVSVVEVPALRDGRVVTARSSGLAARIAIWRNHYEFVRK